jgi:glycosyltransferase involved in cell wall biosynthesis
MRSKKILVVHLDSLFPKVMASQDTVYKMVKRLAQDHVVDLATTVRDGQELELSRSRLDGVCRKFYPIRPINPRNSQIRRKTRGLQFAIYERLFHWPHHYFYAGHQTVMAQLKSIASQNDYDVVQAEYWYMAQLFRHLDPRVFKAIDTHDVLFDKKLQEVTRRHHGSPSRSALREVERYRMLEISCLKLADLVIAVSAADLAAFRALELGNESMLVPVGQDMEYFQDRSVAEKERVVLFYGSMGGAHNIEAFFRFWNRIFPAIRSRVPEAKLLVVGANPPESIQRLHNGRNVIVTGFVEDVRDYLSQAKVAVVPLQVAAGFRSRTVEVLAMRVPIVGTHMALDSIQMEHGKQGYISDVDEEMAAYAATLLVDDVLQARIADACRQFALVNYSIDATIGKLSDYYLALEYALERNWRYAQIC